MLRMPTRFAGGIILKIAYGWTVADNDDFFVTLIQQTFNAHTYVARPGYWLVDSYPIRTSPLATLSFTILIL